VLVSKCSFTELETSSDLAQLFQNKFLQNDVHHGGLADVMADEFM